MANRKEKFFGAVIIDAIGTPLTMVLGIIVTPIFFDYITNTEFGYWTTVLQLMSLLALLNSGIGYYIIQTVTAEAEKGLIATRGTVSSLMGVQFIISLLMISASVLLYFLLPSLRDLRSSSPVSSMLYWLMSVNLILASYSGFLNSILQGQNKVIHTNIFALLNKLSIQALPVVFLVLGFGLISFPFAYLSFSILLFFVYTLFTIRYLKPRLSLLAVSLKELKNIATFSLRTFLGGTSYYVLNFTDAIVIANFISNSAVTVYVLTMKLGDFLRFIPARIINVGLPVLSQLLNEKNYERLQELALKFFRFFLRFGIFAGSCIFLLNKVFVVHWVGYDKFGGSVLTLLSAVICLRESVFPILSSIIYLTKDVKWINYIFLFEAALNITMSLIFVNFWGIVGVALATVLSFSIISVSYGVYKTAAIVQMSVYQFIPSLMQVLIRSIPAVAVLFAAKIYLAGQFSWIIFIASLIIAGLVNVLCFEGFSIVAYRSMSPKQIIMKIIDEA